MYSPFFTNHRRYQQPYPTYHPFHSVYHADPAERSAAPKVVRIPVQFGGSERLDRTESAVKIQKVFRGFLARKSLRKVKDVKMEVDEIEERLRRRETMELVKTDAKERLRMSESLMSLLLKLDSIRGVDLGVRGCRKAVIRKAIGLQERIDAIVAGEIEGGESECGAELEESCGMERGMGDCEEKASGGRERELLEMVVKENEKMVRMMSELFERNEAQTKMLNALTQRVGMLERVIVCDRLRRKKKKAAPLPCTDK
ncbi:BAG family molecular chaperone regulator 5, mitochondrial-like [Salvia hispanica]|uniref:BAG family molecular chaperone regulator 5, mitochondrial-like n=1 Tax=Salvia hispanica TaxID=49212 RepID=UPI00200977F8|nr:BAG family molecular chaperone regulator 5, mitochondrial-like [Salvia hispanica]XP_047973389.1 BAG family molecular chaperone regulator 5, mitochondrial-like [Salvia hispanica]